jgi:hypothetical protein
MQLLLPLFPNETKLITPSLGVFKKDEIVYYIHCGVPIYSHIAEDIQSFRYITSKFITERLCRKIEISKCFGTSYDSVTRYVRLLQEEGDAKFFTNEQRHKLLFLLPSLISQGLLKGKDIYGKLKNGYYGY